MNLATEGFLEGIKGPTRKSRGTRFIFDGDAKLPSDFDDFTQNEDNKLFLNLFIATRAEAIDLGSKKKHENLTLKEADNRIICHIRHMIKADNLISIKVRTA